MNFETAYHHTTWGIRLSCKDRGHVMLLVHGLHLYGRLKMHDQRLKNCAVLASVNVDIFFVATTTVVNNPMQFWSRELGKVNCGDLETLYKLPEIADIVHVRHFTRMSQRRFRWGDCDATREDVQRATDNEDSESLLGCMPAAATAITHGCFGAMPALCCGTTCRKGTWHSPISQRTTRTALAHCAPLTRSTIHTRFPKTHAARATNARRCVTT